jgi:hypothetical protein
MLGDQPLQPHAAGGAEEVGTDLAALERRVLDAAYAVYELRCLLSCEKHRSASKRNLSRAAPP